MSRGRAVLNELPLQGAVAGRAAACACRRRRATVLEDGKRAEVHVRVRFLWVRKEATERALAVTVVRAHSRLTVAGSAR